MLKAILLSLSLLVFAPSAFAAGQRAPTNPCPKQYPNIDQSCQQICQACYQAKYVVGEWGQGDGFWVDCVGPLVTGKAAPKPTTNDGRELPQLPQGMSGVGSTCLAKSGPFWKQPKQH